MEWTDFHDVLLAREVVFMNLFQRKSGSQERGSMLQGIADKLNGIQNPKFKVDGRAIRYRLNKLLSKHCTKNIWSKRNSSQRKEINV